MKKRYTLAKVKNTKSLRSIAKSRHRQSRRIRFWDAYVAFRASIDLERLNIGPDDFAGVRDKSAE